MNSRYLTKSRFKLAYECPAKLFYTKKEEYPDKSLEDTFLAALAEGGFQVGELAKAYYPDGHDIESLDYQEAISQTNALLVQDNVTIFEAAIQFENLFIRIDVLRKRGMVFDLVEVKAKSFDDEDEFLARRSGKVSTTWKPYILDVAFQDYVLRQAFPGATVNPYLMLADKNSLTTVDGLNQLFKIFQNDSGRTQAKAIDEITPEKLGERILIEVEWSPYGKELQSDTYEIHGSSYIFEEYIQFLSDKYKNDEKIPPVINCAVCNVCEFKTTEEEEKQGKLSGFKSCWRDVLGFSDSDFKTPSVMDIWNFRKKQQFLEEDRFFMKDLRVSDFDISSNTQARQWLQIEKTLANDRTPWVDKEGLQKEFMSWSWPLHFIDFETSAVAIPFTRGRRPYEVVAFQFSHHIVRKDGKVEHANQFLLAEPGRFPNIEFVRSLKRALEHDEGTIFRYAAHENTVLNHILSQLGESYEDIPDKDDLMQWIMTITHNSTSGWVGPRNMVDQWDLVKKHFYQLDMGGSNSIKKVLPAVLNCSEYLQKKYSQPIYNSLNFTDHIWIQKDREGRIIDPYSLLPSIFDDISRDELERVSTDGKLADGGAAMTAYARLQFSDVSELERQATYNALLRYCELDTFSMVLIFEAWKDMLNLND